MTLEHLKIVGALVALVVLVWLYRPHQPRDPVEEGKAMGKFVAPFFARLIKKLSKPDG